MNIYPVILSGGAGTRLWPLSREMYPKQLLALTGKQTMLQDTAVRLAGIAGAAAPIVVCNEAHRFTVAEQIRALGLTASAILLEPMGRNTAPAVAAAAHFLTKLDPEAVMLVLPADHVIENQEAFAAAVARASAAVAGGALATFGIVPTAPETGYGYIHRGAPMAAANRRCATPAVLNMPPCANIESSCTPSPRSTFMPRLSVPKAA